MGRITAFLGGDSQVGTTMTALSYGEMLAARGEKTLLICGSGKIGDPFFLNREHHSIDDLRAYLLNGHLAAADLQQVLCRDKNLWILPDVRDSITAAKYDEKTMQRICEAAGTYDHIVLDLGDRIDLGLVVSGIEAADRHYLVVTQQEKVLGRCHYLRDRVLRASESAIYNVPNVLSMRALIGAYSEEGMVWTDEMCSVIEQNLDYACTFIKENFHGVSVMKPQGTYMLYLDCSEWCREHHETVQDLQYRGVKAGVIWQDGEDFVMKDTIRMNLALPTRVLKEAMERLKEKAFV